MRSKGSRRGLGPNYTDRTLDQVAAPYDWPAEKQFVSVDSRDSDGDILLHRAAHGGSVEDVWDLLRLGSDINAKGDLGHTPLHYAAMAGHRSATIALLAAGASDGLRNEWGQTPSEAADVGGHHELASTIRDHQK
ncbi:ankyrin repeat domain-containing protein [Caulobacter sp. 602-2]|uniref:Ankyrin repeat domain-containing protein n=1 Tax=Caulobacter sp. 602-2 TaxID=2710887 RepID=A0A6G4QVU0_9CAUL|nr:ankyrin repeat domain-containing protein [Caulobacter sp. 602-2]